MIHLIQRNEDSNRAPILVLEGGAMRGIFTSGVLDAFMDRNFYFSKVIGISAGCLQGLCYISRQRGRNRKVNTTYCSDSRYMGLSHMLKGGSFFNWEFMFGDLAHELVPFDYETFSRAKETLYTVITDAENGEPCFISSHSMDVDEYMKVCEASCSIPLVSRPVKWRDKHYVDGGVSLPLVPMPEEIPFPHGKIVYVLTRDIVYRKKPVPFWFHGLLDFKYGKEFPSVVEEMCSIPPRYNEKVERVLEMEKSGEVFVIRPEKPVTVSRTERNAAKLRELHGEGYRIGQENFDGMMRWLYE